MHTYKTLQHSMVQIDLNAIDQNCVAIRRHIGEKCGFCAVVKADGYGLGAVRVASRLSNYAEMFAVYSPEEAGDLLSVPVIRPLLVLAPVYFIDPSHPIYHGISQGVVHLVVHDRAHLDSLAAWARHFRMQINVQLKIDTGLHRGGCPTDEAASLIESILADKLFRLTGIMTHFISAVHDKELTVLQHQRVDRVISQLQQPLPSNCRIHEANTAATVQWNWSHRDMVRVGLAWTGVVPNGVPPLQGTRPVISWRTRIAHVRSVKAGEHVGYSGKWTTKRDSTIGIVPVGYASGYPMGVGAEGDRQGAYVRVYDDQFVNALGDAPVVGSVCMDQIAIDLTDISKTGVGCGIELISTDDSSHATLEKIAHVARVVPHAILSRISPKVLRTYSVSEEEVVCIKKDRRALA